MDILYYKDPIGNFGDDLNKFLWDEVAPYIRDKKSDYLLLGVGSLLNPNFLKDNKVIVFGSGVAYNHVQANKNNLIIKCVRGKLTARALGIDESFAISDSAILIRAIKKFPIITDNERSGILFIPHHLTYVNYKLQLSQICDKVGFKLIDPALDSKIIINKISHAKLVISEAMHGAIIADTMRVPWIPVVLGHQINTFKWLDWLSMFNVQYAPIYLGVPNFKDYKLNNLLIKYNLAFFKPNFRSMNEKDLLFKNEQSTMYKIMHKLLKIKFKFIGERADERRQKKMINLMKNLKTQKSFLSDDDIFNERFKSLLGKLEDLK